ncbi:MAG: mucoidy inhibitor MuiA family protein [Alphaproteobacteria bacterium]|nr:mucoidy inhibitor MuiA family protein [Alphaproteobacteria bacterium]
MFEYHSRRITLCLLASGFMLVSHAACATIIDATSRVTAATVLPDRAIITREVKAHVPSGAHVVSIKNIPSGVNEASLRVEGKGTAAIKIGAVEVKHVYLSELAGEAERAKMAEVEAKQDERALIEAEITALDTRASFITRLVNAGAEKSDVTTGAKIDFQPEKWTQAWSLLQTGMVDTQKELAAKRIALRKIDVVLQKLNQELAQVRSTKAMERRDAQIHLEASGESDVTLTLTYQSNGVTWQPVYDARLDTSGGELALEQYGQVRQQTGEDWSDIVLTLSTARPAMSSEMPPLRDWRVGTYAPPPIAMMESSYNQMAKRSAPAGAAMDSLAAAAPAAPEPVAIEAELQQASVVSTEYAAEFKVPGRIDLKSTSDATKLYINTVKMKSALSARVTPRLDPHAYLFVEATNTADFPVIPGPVSKYRDGTFIGNAAMPLLRPSEKADLSFGTDDRVKVTYKRIKDDTSNPALLVGDATIVRQYETKLQNLHKTDLPITIYEQYPISNDGDVKTEVIEDLTSKDSIKDPDNRLGVVVWKTTLKPNEEKGYTLGFKVKYPKGSPINGL